MWGPGDILPFPPNDYNEAADYNPPIDHGSNEMQCVLEAFQSMQSTMKEQLLGLSSKMDNMAGKIGTLESRQKSLEIELKTSTKNTSTIPFYTWEAEQSHTSYFTGDFLHFPCMA